MNDLEEMLNELQVEDFIWIIYIFLSIFALISNHFERQYDITRNKNDKKTFRTINTTIFTITFFIYIYFVYLNIKNLKGLDPKSSPRRILTANTNFIAAALFLIGGTIYLLTSIFGDSEEETLLNFF